MSEDYGSRNGVEKGKNRQLTVSSMEYKVLKIKNLGFNVLNLDQSRLANRKKFVRLRMCVPFHFRVPYA
ncbi:hypothetical protein VspSTUT11_01450 [Vibrio sp. STUT-A11]|nr:hypothetical protein VspSTUT11_01450 [Vibrio sp. STUT-A11]